MWLQYPGNKENANHLPHPTSRCWVQQGPAHLFPWTTEGIFLTLFQHAVYEGQKRANGAVYKAGKRRIVPCPSMLWT